MKYFTRELMERYGSSDDAVADAAHEEWEAALERYLASIERELPDHIREFNKLLLHDAIVWSIARQGNRLILVMRKDIPPRDVVILTYSLTEEPVIDDKEAGPPEQRGAVMDFQYDELELVREHGSKSYAQSIVFGNGWEMTPRFSDVQVALVEPIYPVSEAMTAKSA
jgi:hypothetical protein